MKRFVLMYDNVGINGFVEDGEYFYHHPITNQPLKSIKQIFDGWSEIEEEKNKSWQKLIDCGSNDKMLDEYIRDCENNEIVFVNYKTNEYWYKEDTK
jgi:hypothetical protein